MLASQAASMRPCGPVNWTLSESHSSFGDWMYHQQNLLQTYQTWIMFCAHPDRLNRASGHVGVITVEAHNMAQWHECPQYEQDIHNAIVEHCKMFGPSSNMIRRVFSGKMQCGPALQLLIDTYCLRAYKENHMSDPPDNCADAQSSLTAWSRFHNRVMRERVRTMHLTDSNIWIEKILELKFFQWAHSLTWKWFEREIERESYTLVF